MDSGKIIIINNSKDKLGDQGAEFFGRFFIAQLLATAQRRGSRPQHQKKPVFCYIDECQNIVARDEKIPTILDECRSQRIALILAHQRTSQIKDENVLSALANCAIRFANSDSEARKLSHSLRTSEISSNPLTEASSPLTSVTTPNPLSPSALPNRTSLRMTSSPSASGSNYATA